MATARATLSSFRFTAMRRQSPSSPDLTIHLTEAVVMELRPIPAGEFVMGSRGFEVDEEPRHRVRITRPFFLGIHPVTQEQFGVWDREAGEEHQNAFDGRPRNPAESLDWYQAMSFCAWLTQAHGARFPGHVATLPTEAEWEYACRARTNGPHPALA